MGILLFITVLTPLISTSFSTNSSVYYLIPSGAIQKPALTQNMIKLLESRRNKRQFYLYQQNPMEANVGITPVVNYQVDSVIDSQYANSPQYILVQSRDLIPLQSQILPDGQGEIVNENVVPLITPRAALKNMISLAAQSAMQTNHVFEIITESPVTFVTPTTPPPLMTNTPINVISTATTQPTVFSQMTTNIEKGPRSAESNVTICESSPSAGQGVTGSPVHADNATSAPSAAFDPGPGPGISDAIKTIHDEIKKVKQGKFNGRKEGLPCTLIGTWTSQAAGVIFIIPKEDSREMCITVEAGTSKGFFETTNWEVVAQMPFNKISLIQITAIHQDSLHMATFTGECRICQGKEFISGHWLVVKNESTCAEMNKGQDFFGDLWERKITNTSMSNCI